MVKERFGDEKDLPQIHPALNCYYDQFSAGQVEAQRKREGLMDTVIARSPEFIEGRRSNLTFIRNSFWDLT